MTTQYKELSPLEHILKRPTMYIGTTITEKVEMYVSESLDKIIKKEVNYNAGFIKLFDEILTNASDHFIRTGKVKNIYININQEENTISVMNDGPAIPIEMNENGIYIPQIIFCNLFSGENYEDNEERLVGGLNGLGAKLTNIFSTKFIIDCADKKHRFHLVVEENNRKYNPHVLSKSKESYTSITYHPDLEKFGMTSICDDSMAIMRKRALDIAMYCSGCKIHFNGTLIENTSSLKEYAKKHLGEDKEYFYEKINDYFEVCVSGSDEKFEQVSMVNGISTYLGGTHIDYIVNNITNRLKEDLTKKNKNIKINPNDIKNRLFVFLVCKVPNPIFDTQTKERLKTKMTNEITKGVDLSDKIYKAIYNSTIIESILNWVLMKEQMELNKMNKKAAGKTVTIDKLCDAHKAGTSESQKCSLFIAEGDCLDEDSEVTVFRNSLIHCKLKDVQVDDYILTHKSRYKKIYNITNKVKECIEIKFGDKSIVGGKTHKLLVYDKNQKLFDFIEMQNIDKNIHQLIKSLPITKYAEIEEIKEHKEDKYDLIIKTNWNIMQSSNNHTYAVFEDNGLVVKTASELKVGDKLLIKEV